MTESQQEAIAMLNDMYCSQSKDYQFQYKRNYFALVEFILSKDEVTIAPYSVGFDGSLIQNEPEPDGLVDVPNLHELGRSMLQRHWNVMVATERKPQRNSAYRIGRSIVE